MEKHIESVIQSKEERIQNGNKSSADKTHNQNITF